MRYDADRRRWRLVFRKRTLRRGALVRDESLLRTTASAATAAAAADALDKVAGMIKKAVDRSSGRRVRGEGDRIPAIGTVAPDLPLENGLAARCLATGGMHSSLAGLGAARGLRRSGRFIASACYDVDRRRGFSFSGNARQELSSPTQSLWGEAATASAASAAAEELDRAACMIKKAVYRSSGRRGPPQGRQDPSHQDCCSRSSARRAPEYGHPR